MENSSPADDLFPDIKLVRHSKIWEDNTSIDYFYNKQAKGTSCIFEIAPKIKKKTVYERNIIFSSVKFRMVLALNVRFRPEIRIKKIADFHLKKSSGGIFKIFEIPSKNTNKIRQKFDIVVQ